MTETRQLEATTRNRAGKGGAREERRQGKVPAVIYGDKKPAVMISIAQNKLEREVFTAGFMTHLYEIKVDGTTHRVLPRDVHFDPITDRPLHVDFLRVSGNTKVRVQVPVHFANQEASGIKRGGVLNIVMHELTILTNPNNIPEEIVVDLTGVEIGDSIHLSSIKLPANTSVIAEDPEMTVATIAAPTVAKEAAETTATAAPTAAAQPAKK